MANWAGGVLTAAGRELQAKVEGGVTLNLTKIKLGDGTESMAAVDGMVDLVSPKAVLGISSAVAEGDVCTVTGVLSATQLSSGFYCREWGLFAEDPDAGEILFMITIDSQPEWLPASTEAAEVAATYAMNVAVANAENIEVNIDPAGLVDVDMLNKWLGGADREKAYTVGTIVSMNGLPALYYLKCITPGTTAAATPVIPANVQIGDTITDGTVVWQVIAAVTDEDLASTNLALAESTGYGIISGFEPTISGLTVTVGAGIAHLADGMRKELSATNITLDNADPSNPRIDLVYINADGVVAKVTGTAAASPNAPTLPTGGTSVANVTIAAGATTGTITDKRHYINSGSIFTESDFEKYHDYPYLRLMNDIEITTPISFRAESQIIDLQGHKLTVSSSYTDTHIVSYGVGLNATDSEKWERARHTLCNGVIDCNDVECSVFLIDYGWRLHAENLLVINNINGLNAYTPTATYGSYGAECCYRDVTIFHSKNDNNKRVGFVAKMGDSYFENVVPVFFDKGIVSQNANNVFINCHPWGYPRTANDDFPESTIMSIGFEITTAGATLIGCCADTFEPLDDSQPASYDNGGIGFYVNASQINIIAPRTITHVNTSSSNHVGFYFADTRPGEGSQYLYDCNLITPQVNKVSGSVLPYKTTPLYMETPRVVVFGQNWADEDIIAKAISVDSNYTLTSTSHLFRTGNHIYGNIGVVRKTGTIPSASENICTFNSGYAPSQNSHPTQCGLGIDEWRISSVGMATIGLDRITLADLGSNDKKVAYIPIDYIINTSQPV